MDIIHNPRNFTRLQNKLMETVVGYVWGPERFDIKFAANELTEDVTILSELAPSNIAELPEGSKQALKSFGESRKTGLYQECKATGKGFELLYVWLDALFDYASHTGQLKDPEPEQNEPEQDEPEQINESAPNDQEASSAAQ